MSSKMITDREKDIISILLDMDRGMITAAAISEKLGLSSRTVQRELPGVEKWLAANGAELVKRRGKGLAINASPEQVEKLRRLLMAETILPMYSKNERRKNILGYLFFADEPVKSYVFTSDFAISEGTLFSDLDALEQWLNEYKVDLVRRSGIGIYMEGDETALRHALLNAVLEFADINDIPAMLTNGSRAQRAERFAQVSSDPLFSFFDDDIISFALLCVDEIEEKKGVTFVDSSRIGLILRLSIAIYRMQNNRYVTQLPMECEVYSDLSEFPRAVRISQAIEGRFGIRVPVEETAYIAIHLSATRIWTDAQGGGDPLKSMNVRQLVNSMIAVAEQMTNIPFSEDRVLLEDLTNHVLAMKRNIPVDDVFADNRETLQLRRSYPEIYEAAQTASQVLKEWIYPKELKRVEVALVAIHLMASAERIQKNSRKIVVVVVCPVGIASSKMLAATIDRAYPEIEVRDMLSAFSIDEMQLAREGVDLIISTTPLSVDFPYILVSHILQSRDRLFLQNKINEINRQRLQSRIRHGNANGSDNSVMTLEDVEFLSELGQEIGEILHSFVIQSLSDIGGEDDLIVRAAAVFSETEEDRKEIESVVRQREKQADTFIPEMGIRLLHAKSTAIAHSRVAYLSLSQPMDIEKGKLEGAIVMFVPDVTGILQKASFGAVGCISTLLVDDPAFLAGLKAGEEDISRSLMEEALIRYFQEQVQ